jgi:hypothetical protein
VVLQLLGVVLVLATVWAALQIEGVPMDRCAGDGTDNCAGTTIPSVPQISPSPSVGAVGSLS